MQNIIPFVFIATLKMILFLSLIAETLKSDFGPVLKNNTVNEYFNFLFNFTI